VSAAGQGADAGRVALADYPKTVVLSDGAHLELSPQVDGDGTSRESLVARLPAAERWYLAPDGATVSAATLRVRALDGDRVVGEVTLRRRLAPGERHVASLGLVLDPAYRGRRLGTWMLLDAVHLASALGVERLEVIVATAEQAFLAALRRLDFTEEAVLPDRYRSPEGISYGAIVMAKVLHPSWGDF
jgi:putative acetyltransferase